MQGVISYIKVDAIQFVLLVCTGTLIPNAEIIVQRNNSLILLLKFVLHATVLALLAVLLQAHHVPHAKDPFT